MLLVASCTSVYKQAPNQTYLTGGLVVYVYEVSETPIICYKYNKPIRSTIFNFNKIVNDLDIDSNTPAS